MIKEILVPTDFSKCSIYAVKVAAQLAKKLNARIHFLHVIETPIVSYDSGLVNFESLPQATFMREMAEDNMKSLLHESFLTNILVEFTIEYDAIFNRIRNYIENKQIDMVVMGSHGAKGFNEIILGSNAERVVRYSTCPVLVIKKEYQKFEIKNILIASNFYNEANIMFKGFKQFASIFDAQLHFVRINTPINFETTLKSNENMNRFVDKHQLSNCTLTIYNDQSEEDGILNFADQINADLLAIGTHGRTGLAHLLKGSIAEDVLNHSDRAVLSIKINN